MAARIPKSVADQLRFRDGCSVEIQREGGRVVISRASKYKPTLEELLAGIPEENGHGEWDTGPGVGKDVW